MFNLHISMFFYAAGFIASALLLRRMFALYNPTPAVAAAYQAQRTNSLR